MKQTNLLLAAILLVVLAGCVENKQSHDDLITVDLSKSYPKKELILQDLMDVEYIALETTDEFLTQGLVQDVGKEYLLVSNRNRDGDIFIFDRKTGKGLRKINRQGQGAEEYAGINRIILDESNDEILVMSPGNKILVYDLYGEYKRCLKLDREVSSVFDYDKSNLIGYDMSDYHNKGKDRSKSYHILISKQDGSIIREIFIPFKTIDTPVVTGDGGFVASYSYQIRQSHGKCTLMDTSSDTLYNYAPDGTLTPFIVRTPSAHTMEPEVFLYMGIYTDRYYFMRTMKEEVDFKTFKGFPSTDLVYDKQEKALFEYTLYNADYSNKQQVSLGLSFNGIVNHEIATCQSLEAASLIEAHEKGQLKGRLKEIAAGLDEESNAVIMLVKYRKK